MYHDEFAKVRSVRFPRVEAEDNGAKPSLEILVAGGVSMGLLVSLSQSLSLVVFQLGGLLPLVADSIAIALGRTRAWFDALDLGRSTHPARPMALPLPSHHLASKALSRSRVVVRGGRVDSKR
jgi:hypothetical protein